ncbi:MAG TPA: NAD(P)-dependent oxidoreductase [Candidatus Limnocylindrales bacterium]|nr:NAD(P)-dependent oxidoreductase [Candidatus Limnocylindrales bacterium]
MNKFKKILMIGYSKNDLGEKEWILLRRYSISLTLLPKDSVGIISSLSETDCLLVKLGATVDKHMIDAAPNLRYIGMLGTGYGRIDTTYAAKRGITVCNIAGYSKEGVAELAFGIILDQIRKAEQMKLQARKGDYSEPKVPGSEIKGKSFGVIGLGNIGGRIAEIAKKGFQADVSYWSRHRKKDAEKNGIKFEDTDRLLKNSDFLSLNLSFVPETKEFIDKRKIGLIKLGAIVLNLAPMELVDLDALENRLKKGDITFITDHADELSVKQVTQLGKYRNCIMYPPIGYVTKEATAAKMTMFVKNINNFLNGEPSNKVN